MTSKIALNTLYPSLQKLFQVQLRISIANSDILALELKTLVHQWDEKTIPSVVRDQIHDIFLDISTALLDNPAQSAKWVYSLADEPIFPIECPARGSILCKASDYFYIPDKSGRYRSIFAQDVPLLSVTPNMTLGDIQPIFDSDIFESHPRYLEHSVTHISSPQGPRQLESATSTKYAGKTQYIERYGDLWPILLHGLTYIKQIRT